MNLALRAQEFDGDVAEGRVAEVAGNVREAATGEVHFAVFEDLMQLGLSGDGVDNVRRTKNDIEVVEVVLVKKRGVVGRDFHVVGANVAVFDFQMMVGLAG